VRNKRFGLAGLAIIAALGLVRCGKDTSEAGSLDIQVTVSPGTILADGRTTALVNVKADGYEGPMTLATNQGALTAGTTPDGGSSKVVTVMAASGSAVAVLRSCNADDPADRPCGGQVRLTVEAQNSQGFGYVTFACNGECPTGDGGSGGSGGGGSGGGGTGGTGGTGISGTYTIKLAQTLPSVRSLFEVTQITATVQKDGKDLPTTEKGNVDFSFVAPGEAYLGLTRPPMSTTVAAPLDKGKASVFFTGEGTMATATVTATYQNGTASIDVGLDPGPDLAKILVDKNSNPVVGVRGSINEKSSEIVFALTDQANKPVPPGIPVKFTLTSSALDSLEPYETVTDDAGKARTVFTPGGFPGSAGIKASAQTRDGLAIETTANVSVQNGVPSQRDIAMVCDSNKRFMSWECDGDSVSCTVFMNDRSNANVNAGLDVFFMAETGQVDPSTKTAADGTAKFDFLSKFPGPTVIGASGDPRTQAFVTILGYTRGEEQFEDCNANGFYDRTGGGGPAGTVCQDCDGWRAKTCDAEPFTDIAEPFVDSDGNGRQNGNEKFKNGSQAGATENWDGPNGVWDKDTNVWVAFDTVWIHGTVNLEFLNESSPMPACTDTFLVHFADQLGNCANPDNTGDLTVKVKTTGVQGNFSWSGNKVKVDPASCYDMSAEAQIYPLQFQVTSKAPDPVDPMNPEPWPITLEVTGSYTPSCDMRHTPTTSITCDGRR
jgi:hypothetical protein